MHLRQEFYRAHLLYRSDLKWVNSSKRAAKTMEVHTRIHLQAAKASCWVVFECTGEEILGEADEGERVEDVTTHLGVRVKPYFGNLE